ncbi:MAG: hypothetical protein M4579_000820 [Chaenotheca gracillima]|nr:MAG: hypothetical protein M4579_000820 [Chaenotheca gracillima]
MSSLRITTSKKGRIDTYESRVVAIVVGWNKRSFNVHQAVLEKSGFFRRLNSSESLDAKDPAVPKQDASSSGTINLYDEDPALFRHVVEFLYTNEYGLSLADLKESRGLFEMKQCGERPMADDEAREDHPLMTSRKYQYLKSVRLYCLAVTLDIPSLQALIIEKLRAGPLIPVKYILEVAQEAYKANPDISLRKALCEHARDLSLGENVSTFPILSAIYEGGSLAVDLFNVFTGSELERSPQLFLLGAWDEGNAPNCLG